MSTIQTEAREALEAMDSVRAVRGPTELGYLHVAVRGTQTYVDSRLSVPGNRVVAPMEVVNWVVDNGWRIGHLSFYTAGEYAGCFALRLEPCGTASDD